MLQGVTRCYVVLQGVTWCYKVLDGVTGCYMVLHGVTGCYLVLHGATRCQERVLQDVTLCYKKKNLPFLSSFGLRMVFAKGS